MPRWGRADWDEDDILFCWEVGDDGWVTRSVELQAPDQKPTAAASLDEWMRELDAGRIQQYQARNGVLPEKPIIEWDFPHEHLSTDQFHHVWITARQELENRGH